MKSLGYYNGKWGPLEEMQVPMIDRSCYFGDAVYDATLARNRVIFALDEHVNRFYKSAEKLRIEIPHEKEEWKNILREMVQKTESGSLMVYFQASRGAAPRSHAFPPVKASMWIMLTEREAQTLGRPMTVITQEDTRFLHCDIKTANLIPGVMAAQKAAEAGCDEVIFHRGPRVTECAHSNVHILRDGVFITPPADNLILAGIARAHLLKMCRHFGIETREIPFTMDELTEADEVLLSSSANFCERISHVDGKPVGGRAGDTVARLQKALTEEFLEETKAQAGRSVGKEAGNEI